jgi:hypothetical protein
MRQRRVIAQGAQAQAKRAETQRRHVAAQRAYESTPQHGVMDEETYRREVLPLLAGIPRSAIATALGVSQAYAAGIRRGKRVPHARQWETLAHLVASLATG